MDCHRKVLGILASEVRTIALSGYYGFNNSGDEAVLVSILTALERASKEQGVPIEPIVLSGDPETTTKLYGVRAVHRMKPADIFQTLRSINGLISGGGSLLQDATSSKTIPYYVGILKLAQWLGKPTYIYAQGVGPVQKEMFFPMIRNAFQKSSYISVRDAESKALLGKMGLAQDLVQVVPDPVMGLRLPEERKLQANEDERGLPYVGVSVRYWNEDRSDLEQIASMLQKVMEKKQVHLRFLPFHGGADEEASTLLMKKLGNVKASGSAMSISPAYAHPLDMLAEVGRCQLLIGMRLHSLIYAASQRVPVLGISYDPKIDQFLNRLGDQAIGSTKELHAEQAAQAVLRTLDDLDGWREKHKAAIDRLIEEAERPAAEVIRLLGR